MSSHLLSVTHQSLREGQPQVRRVEPSSGDTADSEDMQKCWYRHSTAQVRAPEVLRVGCYGYSMGLWWPRAHREAGQSFEV